MKTNFKRIGKQSISIVLAVMMMLSTMLVGMVTSNAVEIKAGTDFYLDIRNATEYFNNPNTIYMSVVDSENANYESNADAAIEEQKYKPKMDTWYQMKTTDKPNIYKVTVTDSSSIGKVSFWNNYLKDYYTIYGVSCALCQTYDGEKNLFTLSSKSVQYNNKNSRSFDGTWSTYGTEPTTKYDVIVDQNITNGKVETSATSLAAGETFTVTATPNPGYVLNTITVTDADGKSVEAIDASKHTYKMPANKVTVSATFAEKSKTKYAVVGYLQNLDTNSTEPTHLYANGIKFVDGVAVIDVDADNDKNWFAIADDNGNYYSCSNQDVVGYTSETKTKELTQGTTKPDGLAVPWIGTTGVYRLHLVEGSDSKKLNIWVESVTNPWRIYGTTNYFKDWDLASTGDPIALSYNGNANQYYYPVEVTDITKNIYFGLYFNNRKHQPAIGETNTVLKENTKISGIDEWTVEQPSNSFEIDPDTTGTYYICVDTATNSVWYEKAQTQPVPITLHATTVEGGAAYIYSYTDNETGEEVIDPKGDNNLQTVNAKPNTSVTFKAKEVNGYFPMWNVDGKKSTGATFTLDASSVTGTKGVTVYLTYEEIKNYNLTIISGEGGSVSYTNNETTGTVETGNTSPAISVDSNKTITLTAKADSANSYVFKGWEFDSDAFSYVSGDSLSASITIRVVGNVKATATFEKNSGELTEYKFNMSTDDKALANDTAGSTATSYIVYKQTDGTYTVTLPASEFKSSVNYFVSFSTDGTNDTLMPGRDSSVTGTVDSSFAKYANFVNIQEISKTWFYPIFSFQNIEDITSVKFIYNPETKTYTVTGTYYTVPSGAHTVYATKGNTRSDGSMQYGTTTISLFGDGKIYKTRDNGSYNEYVVGDGNQITVECKVTDAQAKLGYYVYAFVVNGAKFDVIDTGNNVYQTTAPITVSSDLEITPVYYNKQIEADGNYVTIYTNAPKELQDSWGNSISIYSWYDNNGAEMNGSYPGQLMMRDSQGKFGAKVPKYSYYEDENGKYVPNKTQKVLGITNNNYSENQVVHTKFLTTPETQKNHQTYDYDDFEKLTGLGYDTVQFDIKYFPTATDSNQHLLVGIATDQPLKPNFINKTATPYENLTNIDGKLVSILGYTDDNAKANDKIGLITGEPLQIISVGNQSVKIGEETTNIWSTIWYVYDSKGKYITQGLPSDFIPRGEFVNNKFVESESKNQTDAYNAIKAKNLEYNSAVISYEKEMDATNSTSGNNSGWRVDGRWYYARSTDKVDVNVGIIYKNNAGKWTVDTPTETSKITGMVTGGSASFDYTDSRGASHTNLASATVERNTVIKVNATHGTQYKFIGWGTPTYDADGRVTDYTPINLTDLNATYTVSTNTKLYAMYVPYEPGSVTINHSKYTGADSHNGLGLFYVTAEQVDKQGKPIVTNSDTATAQSNVGSVELKITNRPDTYIKVTLTTQSYAKSHFLNFYYPEVASGAYTLKKEDPDDKYYDRECTADDPAIKTYMVKVSDLFDTDGTTLKVKALNYYSDLKLPEVKSNITFNYNPYSTAPNQAPPAGKGTGKTTFTITIKDKDGKAVYTSAENISSLTLKANDNIKSIVEDYVTTGNDYTITITMNPDADNHCTAGQSYYQQNDSGTYTYQMVNNTFDIMLSKLYDKVNNKFNTNTVNLYTDFGAEEFNYNVTFKYLGYESREYYNNNGYSQSQIPDSAIISQDWWRTYTASGTFCGADIDTYYDFGTKTFKEPFLLKVAPYEDNFVQSITWDLENAACFESNDGLSVEATVFAKYKNDSVTVTADFGDGSEIKNYSVNYASLVKTENLINKSTESNENSESKYLIVAPDENADGQKFSYWTIQTDDSKGIEVAKCYTREFNFLAYDNYLITACYGKEDVDASKKGVSATMQFLEYSRNQYDPGRDKVYADFAVSYNYNGKKLCADINNDVVCGVVFVVNSKYSSAADATDKFTVNESVLLEKVKSLNSGNSDKTMGDAKVYNYKLNKKNLDNKNRLEYSWNVNNTENNQNLTILAYSYIYNATTDEYSVSAPQEFKFFNVGNKTYKG